MLFFEFSRLGFSPFFFGSPTLRPHLSPIIIIIIIIMMLFSFSRYASTGYWLKWRWTTSTITDWRLKDLASNLVTLCDTRWNSPLFSNISLLFPTSFFSSLHFLSTFIIFSNSDWLWMALPPTSPCATPCDEIHHLSSPPYLFSL